MSVLPAPQPNNRLNNNRLWNALKRWMEPRSTNRDEAFRERTIRVTVTIVTVAVALSLIASRVVFIQDWTLVSFPTMLSILLVLSLGSIIAINRGRLITSGWLLVMTFLIGGAGTLVMDVGTALALPTLMLSVLVAALVLPRKTIIPVSFVSLVAAALALLPQGDQFFAVTKVTATSALVNYLFLLLTEAFFLRQLRVEFDSRLSSLRDSLGQAEKARQEADKANQAKSQFLANMSHELRTPLNAIIGYVEIMLSGMIGTFTDKQRQIHEYVLQNGKRLLDLINDILDLAKIEAGRLEVRLAPMSPRKVVDDVVNSVQSLATRKNISLAAKYTENTPEVVLCDVNKLQQIVINLVGNALKFTQKGGVIVLVDAPEPTHWQVRVEDTGIGMPPDAVSYIFEMFQQVDSTDARQHQGTGLGLAITKRLIDRLGGKIAVETTLGKGSAFVVTLPRQIHTQDKMPEEASKATAA